jgi:hypothetical protein
VCGGVGQSETDNRASGETSLRLTFGQMLSQEYLQLIEVDLGGLAGIYTWYRGNLANRAIGIGSVV